MNDLVDRYLTCWNETDPEARRALIAQHWSPRPSYTDPVAAVTGRKFWTWARLMTPVSDATKNRVLIMCPS